MPGLPARNKYVGVVHAVPQPEEPSQSPSGGVPRCFQLLSLRMTPLFIGVIRF